MFSTAIRWLISLVHRNPNYLAKYTGKELSDSFRAIRILREFHGGCDDQELLKYLYEELGIIEKKLTILLAFDVVMVTGFILFSSSLLRGDLSGLMPNWIYLLFAIVLVIAIISAYLSASLKIKWIDIEYQRISRGFVRQSNRLQRLPNMTKREHKKMRRRLAALQILLITRNRRTQKYYVSAAATILAGFGFILCVILSGFYLYTANPT